VYSSSSKVTEVKAGYRLHLGFYRFYDHPYMYGSIGISIDEPYVKVSVSDSHELEIKAPTDLSKELIRKVINVVGRDRVKVVVNGFVDHNVGLGSKTRMVLTAYSAISTHFNLGFNLSDLIKLLGRKISGVGIYSFMYGNLVVDSGLRVDGNDAIPKLLHVSDVPSDWYLIVAIPEGIKGLSEGEERSILEHVDAFDKQGELYREFIKLTTALVFKDFNEFTQALTNIQLLTGRYFSKFQGGIYAHEVIDDIINFMKNEGVRGLGQSSWGPTTYGFVDSYAKALSVKSSLTNYMERRGMPIRCWVTNVARLGHQIFIHPANK